VGDMQGGPLGRTGVCGFAPPPPSFAAEVESCVAVSSPDRDIVTERLLRPPPPPDRGRGFIVAGVRSAPDGLIVTGRSSVVAVSIGITFNTTINNERPSCLRSDQRDECHHVTLVARQAPLPVEGLKHRSCQGALAAAADA